MAAKNSSAKKPRAKKKMDINTHVGERLRMRRITIGLSQEAVGNSIGVAAQQVQKYEKGTNAMNAQRLHDFAVSLKIPVSYFFEGLDVPKSKDLAQSEMASDRETIEMLKSFKRIKDYALRKRIADLLRSMSLKDL